MKLYNFITKEEIEAHREKLNSFWRKNTEKIEKLRLTDSQYIFSQAEKQLAETIEIAQKIYERYYTLVTIISGILIGLVSFGIARWVDLKKFDMIVETTLVSIFYLMVLGIFIFCGLKPRKYWLIGGVPEDYFTDGIFQEDATGKGESIAIHLLITEFINYSERIFINKTINENRWHLLYYCLWGLFAFPFFICITFGLIYFL